MKHFLFLAFILATVCISCDDDTDSLGATIADIEDNAEYTTQAYNVATETVRGYKIHVSSLYSYLGKIYDPETMTTLSANYMTQLVPRSDTTVFAPESSLAEHPTTTECNYADSCCLILTVSSFYGDSLAQMKVVANELKKPYTEGVNDTLGYDPTTDSSIYDPSDTTYYHQSTSYTTHDIYYEVSSNGTSHSILIPMNSTFYRTVTDKDGVSHKMKFNNYASYIMYMYYNHPSYFTSPVVFNNKVCSGFYIQTTSGQGSLNKVTATALEFAYRLSGSTTRRFRWLMGTKEVIQQSSITEDVAGSVDEFVNKCNNPNCNYTYVQSPLGIYTKMTLPVDSIMNKHQEDSLSTVRIYIPRVNTSSTAGYVQDPPTTLLMLRAQNEYSFFNNKTVTDNKTSYLCSYSSTVNGYTFDNVSDLVTAIFQDRENYMKAHNMTTYQEYEDEIDASGNKIHEDWNKVLLIPVETSYDSNSILLSVTHAMPLQGAKLKKGTTNNNAIKASVIYSRFKDQEF